MPLEIIDLYDNVNQYRQKFTREAYAEFAVEINLMEMYGDGTVNLYDVFEASFKERCRSVASEGAQEVLWDFCL